MALRLGLVTDVHHGPDTPVRPGHVALPLLAAFVGEMRDRFRPAAILDLGDRINDRSPAEDTARIADVMTALGAAAVPVLALHGNHDVVNLDVATVTGLLGRSAPWESVAVDGAHLVLLNTQDPMTPGGGGSLSAAQLDWLEEDLARATGPVLVFSHHPLDEQDTAAHWYFPTHPGCALAAGRARAREILARSGKVRGVFSGHLHWNHAQVLDGIPYVTVGSLVEVRLTGGRPAGSFAEITLERSGRLAVEVRGALPFRYVTPR